ncbi:hypothetical protein PAESOLCIP111_04555 [Paenibacillus solanacearum]|uniref:Uncharacterized protein n=1 Tax=Paenibacillus solanacearum TaxID=2048548 RepID=A0A916NRL2_9BACL|nr:hypothetical protein PAESOLCIP111_04555 [Paenibacillus solanacearum]
MRIPTCYLSRRTAASIKFDIPRFVGAAEQSIKRMEKRSGSWGFDQSPRSVTSRNSCLEDSRMPGSCMGYPQAVTVTTEANSILRLISAAWPPKCSTHRSGFLISLLPPLLALHSGSELRRARPGNLLEHFAEVKRVLEADLLGNRFDRCLRVTAQQILRPLNAKLL